MTWAEEMRALNIPHTNYRFACFTPTTSKSESEVSCGVQSYIVSDQDSDEVDPVYLGTALLWSAKHLYTTSGDDGPRGNTTDGFHWIFSPGTEEYDIDVLVGGPLIREGNRGWSWAGRDSQAVGGGFEQV